VRTRGLTFESNGEASSSEKTWVAMAGECSKHLVEMAVLLARENRVNWPYCDAAVTIRSHNSSNSHRVANWMVELALQNRTRVVAPFHLRVGYSRNPKGRSENLAREWTTEASATSSIDRLGGRS
jgi:hypothetical protein